MIVLFVGFPWSETHSGILALALKIKASPSLSPLASKPRVEKSIEEICLSFKTSAPTEYKPTMSWASMSLGFPLGVNPFQTVAVIYPEGPVDNKFACRKAQSASVSLPNSSGRISRMDFALSCCNAAIMSSTDKLDPKAEHLSLRVAIGVEVPSVDFGKKSK